MQKVTFRIPEKLIEIIDELVKRGLFDSRSEMIRFGLFWQEKERGTS